MVDFIGSKLPSGKFSQKSHAKKRPMMYEVPIMPS
jgi:hypothetical protein